MRFICLAALLVIVAVAAAFFGRGASPERSADRQRVEVPAGAEENDPTAAPSGDQRAAIAAAIVGEWRSVDDPTFTRVFESNGNFHDTYNGDPAGAPGRWSQPTDGSADLLLASEGAFLPFRVVAVTSETLQLVYLEGNGVQRYGRVK
jgi:hypothetical protein